MDADAALRTGRLEPLSEFTRGQAAGVSFLLSDVDDTITTDGRLFPGALEALWELNSAGIRIILVTGGSAGWADTYFRQWPVDAVITESGALAWYRDDRGRRVRIDHPGIEQRDYRERAQLLIRRVLSEVPGSKLSADQFCRIYDIAFDHHDEEPWLGQVQIEKIRRICDEEGASCGVSSIHVNCWFGTYDKLSMVKLLLEQIYRVTASELKSSAVYCGDAANDGPLFAFFPLSFGVDNVRRHLDALSAWPAFVAGESGGNGFAEIAHALLARKSGRLD
jgi:HAD superfamily hydrolase (TIGR01484 family)